MTEIDPDFARILTQLRATQTPELIEELHAVYLALPRAGATTTPGGLPYPDPTDPVAEGANAIRALAEAVDSKRLVPTRLEASSLIPMIADCNLALNAGWYRAPSAANSPVSSSAGHITVYRSGSTTQYIRQDFRRIFINADTSEDARIWTRTSMDSGASWSPWKLAFVPEDTGWSAFTNMVNGFSAATGLAYRRYNGVVYLKGECTNSTAPTALTTACTLPTGYRPDARIRTMNFASDYGSPFALSVETNGQVQISANFAKPSTPGYHINTSFIAAP